MNAAPRGMTLVDVLVGAAIATTIFAAIIGLLMASERVSTLAAETAAATAIANSQMEYIRSLPYDSVGTVGGIPAGVIAQNATTTEDNVSYGVRTFIDYYDDPADGSGGSDTNSITTDYKRAKVTVSFTTNTGVRSFTIVTTIAPPGIETTTNGGTLRVSVVNAAGSPVSNASVRIVNTATSPTVDLTTYSDSTGIVYLPGAATSTGYQITVAKSGYSTAQTYDRDTTNQNPNPGHLTVVKNTTTSATFAIDQLATFILRTFSPIVSGSFSDTFTDGTALASTANVTVSGGALSLTSNGAGAYLSPGSATASTTAPTYLAQWSNLSATLSSPVGTTAVVQVLDGTGALLPDTVLPGNSTGFALFPVDLSTVSTTTYPSLALRAALTGGAATPSILDWTLSYTRGPVPLPNISFTLTGAKTIGSTGVGAPIYKTTISSSTDATGVTTIPLEWDSYQISISGHTIVTASPNPPYNVLPATTTDNVLILSTP